MNKILTLTSDFGDSHYVAQMKAAALRIAPEATLVDITHSIAPQDILSGAVVLQDCLPHFPAGSAHVAVVDPGVGTDRAIIGADLGGRVVVAPDNGLISLVMQNLPLEQAVRIEHRAEFGPAPSSTFHGRDIMAPAAAMICNGTPLNELGPPHEPMQMPVSESVAKDGHLVGEVVLIDSFGNLITNIFHSQLPDSPLRVRCRFHEIPGLEVTYGGQPEGQLIALVGSGNRLEIAVVRGSAARRVRAQPGDRVEVIWEAESPHEGEA